ncbi:BTAD domain-containing putative transcriptional regulator [Planomonospora corallina]|uniref:BTAD domain-containing putative transcriptional regulator n=1 Tax=Planomonospora corallina TaxID=1806052 RepID=A0ABV8I1A9_9ACTN
MPTRQPMRIRPRRTAGDLLAGLGALVLLAALVGGVPYALLRLAGPPLPPELLDLDLLSSQVGTGTVVAILVLLVWLAWLQLVVCVVVELYAGIRRVGMPARVPLSGGTQALANRLVSAVLLLFTVSAVAVPLVRPAGPPADRPAATAAAGVSPLAAPVTGERADLVPVEKARKVYVVQPPHGRHHESLWEIAEKCLGDGRRYAEIYRLNQHKEQPDGSRLRIADLIRPGWVLDMPDDARNVHIVPAGQSRPDVLREHPGKPAELDGRTRHVTPATAPAPADAPADAPEVSPERPAGAPEGASAPERAPAERPAVRTGPPPAAAPEASDKAPEVSDGAPGSSAGAGEREGSGAERGTRQEQQEPEEGGDALGMLDYLAGASLAAAGLLAALGRRRREQLWHRAFGRRIVRPRQDAAEAELALRLGADAPGSRMLDLGLRLLGRSLAEAGRVPPTVYAAHLSPRHLDLWIHPPDPGAPEPWTACDGGQVWRLPAHEGRLLDERVLSDAPAPYPGLVSLGGDGEGRLLVDLEAAHGLIGVRGAQTTAALAALAVELATNRWSDRMRVTLVGFGEELVDIAPERIRCVSSLAEVLPELEAEARAAAAGRGYGAEVLTGRIHGRAADPVWSPHYLLSAITPSAQEARRLALLARKGARTAAGYVVAGDVPDATWNWEIDAGGRVRVDALGFEVTAQLLPRRQYRALVELFATARRLEGEPLADDAGPVPQDPSVEVRILGPVEIAGPPPMEEGRAALAVEMVVYLATHPDGVHPVVLGGVLWPRGVQAVVRDATVARVAAWLGTDSAGRPNLYADSSGRLRLGPEVRTDWALFRDLVRRSHGDAAARAVLLEQALGLVRGPLLNGRPRGRYAWLAADDLEYEVTAGVADAAHRLCEVWLEHGEAGRAVAAARAGLLLAADDEGLWRDLLRAAHRTGDPARLRAVADALHRRAASHPYGGGMAPETEALIDELLPAWRMSSAPSA